MSWATDAPTWLAAIFTGVMAVLMLRKDLFERAPVIEVGVRKQGFDGHALVAVTIRNPSEGPTLFFKGAEIIPADKFIFQIYEAHPSQGLPRDKSTMSEDGGLGIAPKSEDTITYEIFAHDGSPPLSLSPSLQFTFTRNSKTFRVSRKLR